MKTTKGHAHLDVGTLASPTKMANGWMRVDAFLTRSGVFTYRNPDGSTRREYRPDSEVFKTDSMDSLRSLPVTDNHPPALLDSSNTSEHMKGALESSIRKDGDKLSAGMLVTDGELVGKLERGDAREVSCGYVCDLEWAGGTSPNGERYDAVQRNIVYNHVALLPKGRAGSEVRVRMDAAELDVLLSAQPVSPNPKESNLKTIRIDGIDYPVDSDAAVQAMARHDEKVRTDAAAAAKNSADLLEKLEKQSAKMDAALAEVADLKAKAIEAPKKIRAELEARTALENTARKVLGNKVSFDGLDEAAIRGKVVLHLAPKSDLTGKTPEYLAARFDAEMERFDASATENTTDVEPGTERADGAEERLDADESRKKMIAANKDSWKKPIGASVDVEARGLKIHRA